MRAQLAIAELLEPLRADPARAAALLDIDGTLAPIVRHASDANVPEPTRARLIELAKRYGLVACVSGRPAAVARQIVSIGSIAYVGNHGCELLRAGATEAIVDPSVARLDARASPPSPTRSTRARCSSCACGARTRARSSPSTGAARPTRRRRSRRSRRSSAPRARTASTTRRGRKVLEIRPPVPIDKGRGIRWLLADDPPDHGVYVGDDITDIDAFAGLREVARRRRGLHRRPLRRDAGGARGAGRRDGRRPGRRRSRCSRSCSASERADAVRRLRQDDRPAARGGGDDARRDHAAQRARAPTTRAPRRSRSPGGRSSAVIGI